MTRRDAARDMWTGVGVMALAAAYFVTALYEVNSSNDFTGMAGRQMPMLVTAFLLLFGGVLAWTSWRKRAGLKPDAPLSAREKAAIRLRWQRVFVYLGIVAVYSLGFAYVGFVVSSFFALIVLMTFSGATNRAGVALTSALAPVITWFVFAWLVETPMPDGLLF